MCGIFGFFTFDAKIHKPFKGDILNILIEYAQKRGNDGYGYNFNGKEKKSLSKDVELLYKSYVFGIFNSRAKPEMEIESSLVNLQPIIETNHNSVKMLVHNGSLSNKWLQDIYSKYNYKPTTDIDSEGLLLLCKNGITKEALEAVDGGFAFIYMEYDFNHPWITLKKIIVACKYQPLYVLEIVHPGFTGNIYIFHSSKEALVKVRDMMWGERTGTSYWIYEYPEYTCTIFDTEKIHKEEFSFKPYYFYPNKAETVDGKIKVLSACSGGIDSTTSLILADKILKEKNLDYSIDAVHFLYGHRGEKAEEIAIENILNEYNKEKDSKNIINLKKVDLRDLYKNIFAVKKSQLINKDLMVETADHDKLKSTVAWVPARNMLFQTILIGLAETYILEEGYEKVYLIAGWNQLSEEGFYPDNSSRFSNTMKKAAMFGTLVGDSIHNWNICSNILKCEQWLLAKHFDFLHLFKHTISCDIPVEDDGYFYNCNGQCGSTLLSMWASKRYKDIIDPRVFKNSEFGTDKNNLYQLPKQEPKDYDENTITGIVFRLETF